jgi:integrase
MATFELRESGWWQAKVRRKGYPAQSKTFETKSAAKDWAKKIEAKMAEGVFVSASDAERTTLGDLIDRFITDYAEKPENYKQREDKKEAWRFQLQHLKNALGQYSLAVIDQKLIRKYRTDRGNTLWRGEKIKDSTIRKEIFMLSKLFSYAEKEENITLPRGNPVEKISKPGEGKARDRRLTKDEMKKLLAECKASRNIYLLPAVELAIELAMRQGEILALDWKDVDQGRSIATIRESKTDDDDVQGRIVPLSPRAINILKTLPRKIGNKTKVIPVQRMTLYHVFHAAVVRAGINDFTFHDLRHESLSRLSERGDFSMLEMAAVSGHRTLQMLKRYNHQDAERLAKKLKRTR